MTATALLYADNDEILYEKITQITQYSHAHKSQFTTIYPKF